MTETKNCLTVWGDPDEYLCSQFGAMTYRAWCLREARRIRDSGGSARMVELNGKVSISRV